MGKANDCKRLLNGMVVRNVDDNQKLSGLVHQAFGDMFSVLIGHSSSALHSVKSCFYLEVQVMI